MRNIEFLKTVCIGFLLLFACGFSKILIAEETITSLDKGTDEYWRLMLIRADDPEKAKERALRILQDKVAKPEERLQSFVFLLNNIPENLSSEFLSIDSLKARIAETEQLGLDTMSLELRFYVGQEEIKARKGSSAETEKLLDEFIALAKVKNCFRFQVSKILAKGFLSYGTGDMKQALFFARKAMNLLNGKVPSDDLQLLVAKTNIADFLEYTEDLETAEQIQKETIAIYQKRNLRNSLAEANFGYGLMLSHKKKFIEAEKAYRTVESIARDLHSDYLLALALRGIGYVQSYTSQTKLAIQSYLKALAIMEGPRGDPIAIADTYKLLAIAYSAEKKWTEVLKALEVPEKEPTAMQDKKWVIQLQELKVKAFAELGNIAEALRLSRSINELHKEVAKMEKTAELNKLKISMGLQLQEQKNQLLVEQNKAQEDKIHNAEVMRKIFYSMLGMSVLVIVLLLVSLRQTLKAKKIRERGQRILENIEEGILSIGPGMKVEADLSPYLARLLDDGESPHKSEDMFNFLLERADLLSDERATIKAALGACLGEDALTWDLNFSQLPNELPLQNGLKQISLTWQPLYSDDGRIQNVLITVRDITVRRKLQNEVLQAHAHASRMEQRLSDILHIDARAAEAFVNEARIILPTLRPSIENNSELTQCFRVLHTLKGMARTLGFKEMSSLVHSLEDQLDLQNQIVKQKAEGLNILDQIEKTVHEYNEIIEKVYFRQSEVAGGRAVSLVDLVATSIVPVRSMLEQTGMELGQLDIEDHVGTWNKAWLDVAQTLLLHGMTNIADHGYILPMRRGQVVESRASIQIKAWRSEDFLNLELNDKGVGLDMQQLKNLAQKLNFVPEPFETVADVVFLDGASTAEKVSASSGRGMGMAALRSKVMALQGTVNLCSNPGGKGSCLIARLPLARSQAA